MAYCYAISYRAILFNVWLEALHEVCTLKQFHWKNLLWCRLVLIACILLPNKLLHQNGECQRVGTEKTFILLDEFLLNLNEGPNKRSFL